MSGTPPQAPLIRRVYEPQPGGGDLFDGALPAEFLSELPERGYTPDEVAFLPTMDERDERGPSLSAAKRQRLLANSDDGSRARGKRQCHQLGDHTAMRGQLMVACLKLVLYNMLHGVPAAFVPDLR